MSQIKKKHTYKLFLLEIYIKVRYNIKSNKKVKQKGEL